MQKLLNKITFYFLNRAYTQLEASGDLQNADNVAEFLEDYYAEKVNQGLTLAQGCATVYIQVNAMEGIQ